MIVNVNKLIIRIIIIIFVLIILCQYGLYIRNNYRELKFYNNSIKKLNLDKMDNLEEIEKIKKNIRNIQAQYDDEKTFLQINLNKYVKSKKSCKNEKLIHLVKLKSLTNNIVKNINNQIKVWDKNYLVGGNNICAFPQFKHHKDDNKCCPLSFSNFKYFADKKRCGTDTISDRTHEKLGNPIKTCKEAGGYVSKIIDNPETYVCSSYIKSLKGGDSWIELGYWRLGYTKHEDLNDDKHYFSITNTLNKVTPIIFNSKLEIVETLPNNSWELYTNKLLENVDNIIIGDGFIEFNKLWRLGIYDDNKLLLSYKNYDNSFCWEATGKNYIVNNTLWNKSTLKNNIYFGKDTIRFGKVWYIGAYDDKHLSICNKLSGITCVTYVAIDHEKYNFIDVIESKNCKIIKNLRETYINKLFNKTKVFKYQTPDEIILYERISHIPADFSIYKLMIKSFTKEKNILGKDFNLYSTMNDYLKKVNKWHFCNYDETKSNIGFPKDCGEEEAIINRWARNPIYGNCSQITDFKFSILDVKNKEIIIKGPHRDFSIIQKPIYEEYTNIDALEPRLQEIHLEDIDTELKVEVNNNCPFEALKYNCEKGKDCLYQRCCPTGFNNTKHNANYKQCGSAFINDSLRLNCTKSNGYISENIIYNNKQHHLDKEKKIVYNCVNKTIDNKVYNSIYYIIIFITIVGSVILYMKLSKQNL
tara:strand:- start:2096 stop:4192 length:2097 start_codon:yes stop_codon:yes gene_type:complete